MNRKKSCGIFRDQSHVIIPRQGVGESKLKAVQCYAIDPMSSARFDRN